MECDTVQVRHDGHNGTTHTKNEISLWKKNHKTKEKAIP